MKIAAIVPALNEAQTIGKVLDALKKSKNIFEIIVIDDGSTDTTAYEAKKTEVRVISQNNQGKGAAMRRGALEASYDILFFADADLVGFLPSHVDALIERYVKTKADMVVGIRDRYNRITEFFMKFFPLFVLSGERVIAKDLFLKISGLASDFGIEMMMNAYCQKHKLRVEYEKLSKLKQVIKEKKYGFFKGFPARLKMFYQVTRVFFLLSRYK